MKSKGIKKNNNLIKPKRKQRRKNKFGHIKRNYMKKKLEKYVTNEGDYKLFSILSPKDFSNLFVEIIKNLNEDEELKSQVEYYIQVLVKNTIKNSIKIKKIQKNIEKINKKEIIMDRESQRIKDILNACDILMDNSTYDTDDIGLKLTKNELLCLPSNIIFNKYFELQIRKFNNDWRKFCTKISKILYLQY